MVDLRWRVRFGRQDREVCGQTHSALCSWHAQQLELPPKEGGRAGERGRGERERKREREREKEEYSMEVLG